MATTFAEFLEAAVKPTTPAEEELYKKVDVIPFLAMDLANKVTYPAGYEKAATRWCDEMYQTSVSRIAEDPEIKRTRDYINLIMGDQWPRDRPAYRPRPVLNYISKHFWDNLAAISDVHLDIDVRTENRKYKQLAENLTIALQAGYRAQRGNLSVIATAQHASLSMGYTKVAWSSERNDVVYIPCGPDRVIPILGDPGNLQDSAGVVYSAWKPLTWFRTHFDRGFAVTADESNHEAFGRDRPYWIEDYTYSAFSPGLKEYLYRSYQQAQGGESALKINRDPVSLYNEFWLHDPQINTSKEVLKLGWGNWAYRVHPGQRIYPFGRLVCTAGSGNRMVLWDGPNPHWHGKFPFAVLRPSPVPWLWSSISDLRDLAPVQAAINNVVADGLGILKLAVNKVLVTKEGSMAEETWNTYFPGMPGAKIKLVNRMEAIDQQIKWFGPGAGEVSAILPFWQGLRSAFGELGGDIDDRLAGKEQVPSSESIQKFQDSQQARSRVKGHFVEAYFDDLGTFAACDTAQFYTSDKVLSVLGPDGITWDYQDFDPGNMVPYDPKELDPHRRGTEFVKKFKAMVGAGSSLPQQRRETAKIGLFLAKMGKMDLENLINLLQHAGYRLPDAKKIMTNLVQEAQLAGAVAPQAGQKKGR